MVYAVVQTGGKQYKADKGGLLKVERLEAQLHQTLELDKVLLVRDGEKISIGRPYVSGAKVVAQVMRQGRAAKVYAYTYKPRKHSEKIRGHRQSYTQLRVVDIIAGQEA